ncbi:MAG: GntR family transcriptional regulator [Bacteroidales bacterium]|nr:GntR family transcriptional regulator [Bacteroidales bacterium]
MDFSNSKAIYMQIVDYICEQILMGNWAEGERIMSVRDLGLKLEVNPNTVLRAYDYLQRADIIANRRGIGYSAVENAKAKILEMNKKAFIEKEMPKFFQKMQLLQIDINEVNEFYKKFSNK